MLHAPPWIRIADRDQVLFAWDDAVGGATQWGGDAVAARVLASALRMECRARMALAVALAEWVVWRFEGLHQRSEPTDVVEAAWCGTADPRYLRFFELTRSQWLGPVEGPLWTAITHLRQGIAAGVDFPKDLYDTLALLTKLALYVQPQPDALLEWLPVVLDRLETAFPVTPDDPLADLFSRDPSSRMGPWVSRDMFDPAASWHLGDGRRFLQQVLSTARDEKNPFLARPDELADARFTGVPYVLPAQP